MGRKRKHDKDEDQAAQAGRNSAVADSPESPAGEESGGGRGGAGKLLFLLLLAGVLALVLSEGVRSKVLDLLFGSEEEFDYSSTTMPATEAPVGAGA
jgi:hypothetical protein